MAARQSEGNVWTDATLAQLPELAGWNAGVSQVESVIDARTAGMISALLDQKPLRNGDALPPAWHWAYFIEPALQRDIGADGHPGKGGFLPPIALPRRMFAGSKLTFHRPLVIGERYRRASEVMSIEAKAGRSGKLAFVKIRSTISGARDEVHLEEEQDIVYREPVSAAQAPSEPEAVKAWQWRREVSPDPVMLFRYSAATFNGHRIHYDLPYATGEEGYPGLVVHGPLLATLMLELVRGEQPEARVTSFRFAGKRPVFAPGTFAIVGSIGADGVSAELAILSGGQVAMSGAATLKTGK